MALITKKPYKVPAGPVAYFDVDDTLVMWDIPKDIKLNDPRLIKIKCRDKVSYSLPNWYNIDLLRQMARKGHGIIVWSAGGSDWAEAVVDALGLNNLVDVVTAKPSYYIDDVANPSHVLGKHGYFTIDGKRTGTDDHLKHRPEFEDEYEELRK